MFLFFVLIVSVNCQWWCTKYLDWILDPLPECGDYASISVEKGIADNYHCDEGLSNDASVILFRDFENKTETMKWFALAWFDAETQGYSWAQNQGFGGGSAINITSTIALHWPEELIHWFDEDVDPWGTPGSTGTDEIYVRFYRRYEPGYQIQAHKSPGVYAMCCDPQDIGGAGNVPDGTDKFSTKIIVNDAGEPLLYSYHPDQEGIYGDALFQNLLSVQFKFENDVWYCIEMMLKANTPGQRDGEVALWIDGKRIMHYINMRFRDVASLKINRPLHSMWMDAEAQFAQTVWDDQMVWATQYVGPRSECDNTTNQPTTSTTAPTTNQPSEPTTNNPTNQPTTNIPTNQPTTNIPTSVTTNPYDCTSDISPSGTYTCVQYRSWGDCDNTWMVGHCCTSCAEKCNCANTGNPYDCTTDISPSETYTCVQYKSWGDCDNAWMVGYCCTSCAAGCNCVVTTATPTTSQLVTTELTTTSPTTTSEQTTSTPTTEPTSNNPTSGTNILSDLALSLDYLFNLFIIIFCLTYCM